MTSWNRVFAIVALSMAAGCGADSSPIEEMCDRLDECNLLVGSVRGCVENLETEASDLSPSLRKDFDNALDDCLDFNTCELFSACITRLTDGE